VNDGVESTPKRSASAFARFRASWAAALPANSNAASASTPAASATERRNSSVT
jgi:hypothetical protein